MISKVKGFINNPRHITCLILPGVIPLVGMIASLERMVIASDSMVSFTLWVFMFVSYIYIWVFANKLGSRNYKRGMSNYLNGDNFWHYENGGFMELGRLLGHGVCYEAAAMLMMVWRDYEKTRFVCGEAYSNLLQDDVPHAWMEIKAYGIWWVIDAGWVSPAHPIPRFWYMFSERAKVSQVVEHREFFSHKTARALAEAIKNPDTSMCLHKLSAFSRNLAPLD